MVADWRFGEARALLRIGVKPGCRLLNVLRTRGVVLSFSLLGFSLLGRLSMVNPCGGMLLLASNSSGARLLTPTTEAGGFSVCPCFCSCSGVRSLKTGVGPTGVFGRKEAELEGARVTCGFEVDSVFSAGIDEAVVFVG